MNKTLLQSFHWYFPASGNLWNHLRDEAPYLAELGITHVWLPPAYKSAKGVDDPGYGVYDLYDLGEFDQKGSVRTKFGTRDEYLACIARLHEHGIAVLADIILNHRFGADENETVSLIKVQREDRRQKTSEKFQREVPLRFTFAGRQGKYSAFVWDHQCFSGLCLDDEIHLIVNDYNCGDWQETLSKSKGNFDYLVGIDVDFRNPAVREELKRWGEWYVTTAELDGFRFDALKHMSCDFPVEWIQHLDSRFGHEFLVVGEYWQDDVDELLDYLHSCSFRMALFDVPLHFNLYRASRSMGYDMREIFDRTLVQEQPELAVTFVDNHDTQPLQDLESHVEDWFKPLAYALILLREQGLPCVFRPVLYGAKYREKDQDGYEVTVKLPRMEIVERMICVRKRHAYGYQQDYFDDPHVVGWTRHGDLSKQTMGCAVLMSNRDAGKKRMNMGVHNQRKRMVDITGNVPEPVRLDERGEGWFHVRGSSVSVWIEQGATL